MTEDKAVKKINKKTWILGGIGVFVVLFILVGLFGTPTADYVFKGMNESMLKVKTVTVDQKMTKKGTGDVSLKLYMDLSDSNSLKAKGNFAFGITDSTTPLEISGDLIKIGDANYVNFTKIGSTDSKISSTYSAYQSVLVGKWVKARPNDTIASFADNALAFASNIIPTPYGNFNDEQRKNLLSIIQDKSTYTIEESSQVSVSGVSAYKYVLTYNKDQYNKFAKSISEYTTIFKKDDTNDKNKVSSYTVWVNINTKQIIKIEYTGTSPDGDVTGTINFSGYDEKKTVEKPSDYSIESELLN